MPRGLTEEFRIGRRTWLEHRKRVLTERNAYIVEMWKGGVRGKEIAWKFDISHQHVRNIISKAGATRWRRC